MSQGDYPTLQVAALLGLSSRNIPTCVDCRARATAHRLSSVTVSVPPQPPLPRCVLCMPVERSPRPLSSLVGRWIVQNSFSYTQKGPDSADCSALCAVLSFLALETEAGKAVTGCPDSALRTPIRG
jgi:hypothetical protein